VLYSQIQQVVDKLRNLWMMLLHWLILMEFIHIVGVTVHGNNTKLKDNPNIDFHILLG